MRKIISLFLTAVMILGCGAAAAETVKHERVFAVLRPDGEAESITDSVRLENRDGLEELRDRTMLTDILNVGGREPFTLDGNDLVWQASGKDITYQGTSGRALPVKPVVTLSLDGAEISAKELADRAGRAEITVRFEQPEAVPHLAATLLLLPETGVSAVETENAGLISFSGRQAVIGWAVPGADAGMKLPSSFTVRFDADHVRIGWMMTFASADPIDALCREISSRIPAGTDPAGILADVIDALKCLQAGKDLPADTSNVFVNMVTGQINDLNGSLDALSGNSGALNEGAEAMLESLLDIAGRQLAAGADPSGGPVPALTAENYSEVLNEMIAGAQDPALADSLNDLLSRLDRAAAYVGSVKQYTSGVDQVSGRVRMAEQLAASALLNIAETDLSALVAMFESTRSSAAACGYDLRPENMRTVTVLILRTDLI